MSHEKAIFDGVRTRLGVRKSREMSPGHFNILEAQSNQQLTDEDQFLGAFRISCFVYRMISWVVVEWAALTNALSIVEFLRGYSWPHFPHVRVRRAVIPVTPRLGLSARRTALRPVCCAAIARALTIRTHGQGGDQDPRTRRSSPSPAESFFISRLLALSTMAAAALGEGCQPVQIMPSTVRTRLP